MKTQILAAVVVGALMLACGSRMIRQDMNSSVGKPGVIKVWANWVKDKKAKFDMNFSMVSENDDQMIIVFLADISCSRGGMAGQVKHTFFNSGERTIQLAPRQGKNFNMVCYTPGPTTGEFNVTVAKVFENPSKDGKTPGKVIAENLVWKSPDQPPL